MTDLMHSRRTFIVLSRLMAPFIRRGWIRTGRLSGALCILRTKGRKSGIVREVSLNYALAPGGVWLMAGWGTATQWYANLLADKHAEVAIDGRARAGLAATVEEPAERLRAVRAVLLASGWAGRAYGFDPATVDDERLARATAAFPVIHVGFD